MTKRIATIAFALFAALTAGSAFAQMSGLAVLTAPLSPSSENPPVEDASMAGQAAVLIHMTRNASGDLTRAVVDFHITASTEQAETLRAMHIHRGARGSNGGVVVNAGFGPPLDVEPGPVSLFRQMILTDDADLDAVEEILANPGGFYVNIHSVSNPPGITRGQLMRSDAAAISALQGDIDALSAANESMASELADIKETLGRVARRLGVVPAE